MEKTPIMKWQWFDIATVIGLIITGGLFYYGYAEGIFDSRESLRTFILGLGKPAVAAFILLQIIQVILPIIPGALTCIVGVIAFGPLFGLLYNYIGISIGSIGAYLIAKRYGKPLVQRMMNKKQFDKYSAWINKGKRFERLFALAIFAPVAPDDILCYMAGLTKMTLQKFTLIILLCKPASIAVYSIGLATVLNWLPFL